MSRQNGSSAYGRSMEDMQIFYFGCTASLWVTSLGARIQCGGTLSMLPSGRDSVGIGGDVQWNGLTVLYTIWSVDSLLTSEQS